MLTRLNILITALITAVVAGVVLVTGYENLAVLVGACSLVALAAWAAGMKAQPDAEQATPSICWSTELVAPAATSAPQGPHFRRREGPSTAQLLFLWVLATLAVWVYYELIPIVETTSALVAACVGVMLVVWAFFHLVRISWQTLARSGGATLVVFLVGATVSAFFYVAGVEETLIELVYGNEIGLTALEQPDGAIGTATEMDDDDDEGVEWRRPLPGEADLIRITPADFNPCDSGSVFERVAQAVVTLRDARGHGTAFLITKDGLAITNHHVVDGDGTYTAELSDGRKLSARKVRWSKEPDVALVQIACEPDCSTLGLAVEEDIPLGSDIFVVGTPDGGWLHHSITKGAVSGLRFDEGATLIQTDAAVNPGNSGSPIVESKTGEVVGIVSFGLTGTEGLHFGVGIHDALRVLGIRLLDAD